LKNNNQKPILDRTFQNFGHLNPGFLNKGNFISLEGLGAIKGAKREILVSRRYGPF
jgi:hypothetical protein